MLNHSINELEEIEETLLDASCESIKSIDDEINQIKDSGLYSLEDQLRLDGLKAEKNAWRKLRHHIIDLQFDAVKLEEELDYLKRSYGLPTKSYLENLQKKIALLSDQSAEFKSQL